MHLLVDVFEGAGAAGFELLDLGVEGLEAVDLLLQVDLLLGQLLDVLTDMGQLIRSRLQGVTDPHITLRRA